MWSEGWVCGGCGLKGVCVVFEGCDLKRWKVQFKGWVGVVSANLTVAVSEVL